MSALAPTVEKETPKRACKEKVKEHMQRVLYSP